MNFLARFVSFITNPVFVLFPVPYLLIYRTNNDSWYALKWTIFSLVFLFIAGLFTLYEVKKGVFTDLDISKREQRPILFLFIGAVTVVYFLSLLFFRGPFILFITIWGIMVGIIFVSLVNTRVKASLHVATFTCVIITLSYLYGVSYYTFIFVPFIAWARIYAKRHTFSETIIGGCIGVLLTFFMYFVVRYILQLHISV